MSKLKNITPGIVTLQMFNIASPTVNGQMQNPVLVLKPGQVEPEVAWLVSDVNDPSYNAEIVDNYIKAGVLTRIR